MSIPLNNILFLDIETVPRYSSYGELPEDWKTLWDTKAGHLTRNREAESSETIYPRAGIYAEFGRIICISCGILQGNGSNRRIVIKSFCCDDEKTLLQDFCEMLSKWAPGDAKYLCAHNGKEFDFPYLCRRMLVHGLSIPPCLSVSGKKPWEVNHLDTLELWKFGDFKSYTSLDLLARTLDIPTPKDDIDGSKVWEIYWKEKDMPRIVIYCQKDVVTVAQIFLRMQGEPLISSDNIEIKS